MLNWDNPSTWTILIVDDEHDNLEVVAESLQFFGVSVKTALNGEEGLEVLKTFTPTLILLDLSMPKMDGWKMRSLVKADPRISDIPVIALSAHAMLGDRERAYQAGFDGYLTKPVNIPTLLQDIRQAIENRRVWQLCQESPPETPGCEKKEEEVKPEEAPKPETGNVISSAQEAVVSVNASTASQ